MNARIINESFPLESAIQNFQIENIYRSALASNLRQRDNYAIILKLSRINCFLSGQGNILAELFVREMVLTEPLDIPPVKFFSRFQEFSKKEGIKYSLDSDWLQFTEDDTKIMIENSPPFSRIRAFPDSACSQSGKAICSVLNLIDIHATPQTQINYHRSLLALPRRAVVSAALACDYFDRLVNG